MPFRENFARVCFEALLQFSFVHSQESSIGEGEGGEEGEAGEMKGGGQEERREEERGKVGKRERQGK